MGRGCHHELKGENCIQKKVSGTKNQLPARVYQAAPDSEDANGKYWPNDEAKNEENPCIISDSIARVACTIREMTRLFK